jgi:lysophospholipase L1-like esterase
VHNCPVWVGSGSIFHHAVLAAFGVSTLTGGALSPSVNLYEGNQLGPKVAMVGDSLTCLSQKDLETDFGGKYAYQISCHNGISTAEGTPYAVKIDQSVEGAPDVMIVNLGTNDGLRAEHDIGPHNAVDVAAALQSMNNLAWDIQHVPCVIWVTVSDIPDIFHSGVTHAINNWMHSRSQTVPGNYVVDWWTMLQHGNNGSLYLSPLDGIHTTTAGQQMLASMYLQAVQSDCAAQGVIAGQ